MLAVERTTHAASIATGTLGTTRVCSSLNSTAATLHSHSTVALRNRAGTKALYSKHWGGRESKETGAPFVMVPLSVCDISKHINNSVISQHLDSLSGDTHTPP